jgi:transcriptional regulator with XRE-family HTH domain
MLNFSELNCNVNRPYLTMDVKMATDERWEIFGKWFQAEREKTGVSQKVAAAKAPVHVVQLSRIETGKSGVKRETLIELVEAINKISVTGYQININETLPKAGFAPLVASTEEDSGFGRGLERLSPENQRAVRRTIEAMIKELAEIEEHNYDYIDDDEE